jgi:hypothetical protein
MLLSETELSSQRKPKVSLVIIFSTYGINSYISVELFFIFIEEVYRFNKNVKVTYTNSINSINYGLLTSVTLIIHRGENQTAYLDSWYMYSVLDKTVLFIPKKKKNEIK